MSAVYRPPSPPETLNNWFSKRPLLAERAAIALCRKAVEGLEVTDWRRFGEHERTNWTAVEHLRAQGLWSDDSEYPKHLVPGNPREPPLPGYWRVHGRKSDGHNNCPVCTLKTYRDGDWRPEADKARWNRSWHSPCLAAALVWRRYGDYARYIAERQGGVCPETGQPVLGELVKPTWGGKPYRHVLANCEVDHRIPLWKIRMQGPTLHPWPDVLRFWGLSNLQVLSREGHKLKTKREAAERRLLKLEIAGQEGMFG